MRALLVVGRVTAAVVAICVVAVFMAVEAVSRDDANFGDECF